jgi:DNA repair protein RadA/Sms
MGEIGLAGELRRVRDLPQRIAEAARLGFRVAVVPTEPGERVPGGLPPDPARSEPTFDGMRVVAVPDVRAALQMLKVSRIEQGPHEL